MDIENLAEDIILVNLHPEPQMGDELKTLTDIVQDNEGACDVIIDFSGVDIVTSASLSKLLKLRQLLIDSERRFVLCGVPELTRSTFKVTGLEGLFELADDKSAALTEFQAVK